MANLELVPRRLPMIPTSSVSELIPCAESKPSRRVQDSIVTEPADSKRETPKLQTAKLPTAQATDRPSYQPPELPPPIPRMAFARNTSGSGAYLPLPLTIPAPRVPAAGGLPEEEHDYVYDVAHDTIPEEWHAARQAARIRKHEHMRRAWFQGAIERDVACRQLAGRGLRESDFVVRTHLPRASRRSGGTTVEEFVVSAVVGGAVQHWRLYLRRGTAATGAGTACPPDIQAALEDIDLPGVCSVIEAVELLSNGERRRAVSRRLPALSLVKAAPSGPAPPPRVTRLRAASG